MLSGIVKSCSLLLGKLPNKNGQALIMKMVYFKRPSRTSVLASLAGTVFHFVLLHHILSPNIIAISPERLKEAADTVDHCETPSSDKTARIPNIIHQIWKNNDLSTYPLPASAGSWEWRFENASYTIKLWTEDDIVNLVRTSYPWFLSTDESYKYNIQRADVARLMVVHHEGGVYADLDEYPSQDTSVETISCLQNLGYQAIMASTREDRGISNHFFHGRKGLRVPAVGAARSEKTSNFPLRTLHAAVRGCFLVYGSLHDYFRHERICLAV